MDLSELVFTELGENELADFWFRILSKRRLKASDVLILCWEIADVLPRRDAEIAELAAGLTLGVAEVAGESALGAEQLGGPYAV